MEKYKVHFSVDDSRVVCSVYNFYVDSGHRTKNVYDVTCNSCKRTKKYKEALAKVEAKKPKKLSYAKRQDIWIKENNIQKGDKVRVTRTAKSYEDGWDCQWSTGMCEGAVSTVANLSSASGVYLDNYYWYPYFVLEKVAEEIPVEEPKLEVLKPIHVEVVSKITDFLMDNHYMLLRYVEKEGIVFFTEEAPAERIFRVKVEPAILTVGEENE